MILRSLELKNFRGYRDATRIDFKDGPIQIIEGENGAGKSTLVDAIQLALTTNHNSASRQVSRRRPRGTELAPEITITFEHDDSEYRLWKRFLDKPRAKLERSRKHSSFETIAEGKQADDTVRAMLGGDGSETRLSLLLASQDGLELPEISGQLLEDIRAMLGGQMTSPEGLRLEKLAGQRYSEYFTAKRGTERGEISKIRSALPSARDVVDDLRARLQQVEESRTAASDAKKELAEIQAKIQRLLPELERAESDKAKADNLAKELDTAEAKHQAASTKYEQLAQIIDEIKKVAVERERLEKERPQVEKVAEEKKRSLVDAQKLTNEAKASYESLNQPDPELDRLKQLAQQARQYLENRDALGRAELRLKELVELNKQLSEIRERIEALHAPSPAVMGQIRECDAKIAAAQAQLDARQIRLEFTTETDLPAIEVLEGEPTGRHEVKAGHVFSAHGDGRLSFRIPGVGLAKISGPTGDTGTLKQELVELRARRSNLVAPFGAEDADELSTRVEQLLPMEDQRKTIEAQLSTYPPAEQLQEELDALQKQKEQVLETEPTWAAQPPDAAALDEEVQRREATRKQQQGEAYKHWQQATQAADSAREESTKADTELARHRERYEATKKRWTDLQDGRSHEERQEELARRRRECENAEAEVSRLKGERKKLPPDAVEKAALLRTQQKDLEGKASDLKERIRDEEVRQRTILEQSPYSELAEAEELLEELKKREAELEVEMEAVKLIRTTLNQCKADALEGLAGPVEKKATELLERIVGDRIAEISLRNDFSPEGVLPEAGGDLTEVGEMSGGEQEQIWAATRLALADVLTNESPYVVVFDDVFAHTDDARLHRILNLIEERKDRMQFVVLTCHPERYQSLREARRIHLEKCSVRA